MVIVAMDATARAVGAAPFLNKVTSRGCEPRSPGMIPRSQSRVLSTARDVDAVRFGIVVTQHPISNVSPPSRHSLGEGPPSRLPRVAGRRGVRGRCGRLALCCDRGVRPSAHSGRLTRPLKARLALSEVGEGAGAPDGARWNLLRTTLTFIRRPGFFCCVQP